MERNALANSSCMPPVGVDLGRPIRVVVFGGAFFERAALEFLTVLDSHSEVELVGGFCQSHGLTLRHRVADVLRRRTTLAPVVLAMMAAQAASGLIRHPRIEFRQRRRVRSVLSRIETVRDIHAVEVLERVRALAPDLGLVYGAPILKPQLFDIPMFGTLGIHHGSLPRYRGKKTTFWAMLNGELAAGVTIQRINAGLDAGDIVCAGEVPIARKRHGRVVAEVEQLGVALYMKAILAVKRGEASFHPQPRGRAVLYRQPSARDFVRLWYRRLAARVGAV